jgi:hypothetical protein
MERREEMTKGKAFSDDDPVNEPYADSTDDSTTVISPESARDAQKIQRVITEALKSIRYGSLLLTFHEGRLVEFTKTVRSRVNAK